jgi:hypothetical protein
MLFQTHTFQFPTISNNNMVDPCPSVLGATPEMMVTDIQKIRNSGNVTFL